MMPHLINGLTDQIKHSIYKSFNLNNRLKETKSLCFNCQAISISFT